MQSVEFLRAWRQKAREWQERLQEPAVVVDAGKLAEALAEGRPLTEAVPPEVPGDLLAAVLADVAELLAAHRPAARPEVDRLLGALAGADRAAQDSLAAAALSGLGVPVEEWARQHVAPEGLLLPLVNLALQPFMARYARAMGRMVSWSGWRHNYCPVCGREPDVARIDPDNLRYLHCGLCDTQWQTHRLACVWCETDDAKKLQVLTVADLEPFRLDVCDACGGYIKTLDQRHGGLLALPSVDLFVEDARTRKLDLVAAEQGYRRGGRVQ
ncbi:MAG: formate dehydrogenase accessory protein FdhE [Bacillota bacterium]|nr:MAG: hypothetical protein DIU70_04745 [Bacillota bacterium]